jgi:uncharacterized protein YggT (Ycf19 family)
MALLDFILNLIGLLLWFNWRAARFDPLSHSIPATLAGTLRRAEKTQFKRWHLPLGLLVLLLLRAPLYASFGSALNWTGKLDVMVISVPFNSNAPSYLPMLLYSFYSFGVTLTAFFLWVLFLSILKSGAPENDSLRQLLRLHLGRLESWPVGIKLVLPLLLLSPVWYGASWPLTAWVNLPAPATASQRIEQALLVGIGSYLAWKYLIIAVLGLYFVSCYVYFGKNPFWQHLDIIARILLRPLRSLPLRFGRLDLAPVVGICLVLLVAWGLEQGVEFPLGNDASGRPKPRWIDVPGLVDLYRRVSG